MRTLIDGYNLMHAVGLMNAGRPFGPDEFRKARRRFLNDLAGLLGTVEAHLTTVVFDASHPPPDRPGREVHKGIEVVYAVGNDDADERIELLIAAHSHPKALSVVSTDLRIRQAATRRKATPVTSDAYWTSLQERRRRPLAAVEPAAEPREQVGSAADAAYWLAEFGDLDGQAETLSAFRAPDFAPTDAEVERIRREVESEP